MFLFYEKMPVNSIQQKEQTRSLIIKTAQSLIQKYGMKKITLQNIADQLDMTTPSLYTYFENLETIICQAIKSYRQEFFKELEQTKRDFDSFDYRVQYFIIVNKRVLLDDNKICLCSAMASDFFSLSPNVQKEVTEFILETQKWIESTLLEYKPDIPEPKTKARIIVAGISGLMINYRAQNKVEKFQSDCLTLVKSIV